jgi:hypothetical protein
VRIVNDAQFDFRPRAHQSQPTEQQPAGDHNDLQYRLNGVILRENISVLSQQIHGFGYLDEKILDENSNSLIYE